METRAPGAIEAYLAQMPELPGVVDVRVKNAKVHLRMATNELVVPYELHGVVTPLLARHLVERRGEALVLARFVAPAAGRAMTAGGVQFIDLAGNCHLGRGGNLLVHVEGKRRIEGARRGRGLGMTGYEALFAILVRPALLDLPVREFAATAGLPKTVVGDTLQRLANEGAIAVTRGRRKLLQRDALMTRWLAGYEDQVRPKLLLGHFRPPEKNPLDLERRLEGALADREWAWGGTAAAYRLTRHYRGETTVLHLAQPPANVPHELGVLPDPGGPLVLLRFPGRLAADGPEPRVVHPLLIYAELLHGFDDRAHEAAVEIRERFLAA